MQQGTWQKPVEGGHSKPSEGYGCLAWALFKTGYKQERDVSAHAARALGNCTSRIRWLPKLLIGVPAALCVRLAPFVAAPR